MIIYILVYFFIYSGIQVQSLSLEERLTNLEKVVSQLEESLVKDYGLIKRCRVPQVEHGEASCDYVDLKPGSKCKVICDAGWTPSPGKQLTRCQEGGEWDVALSCELPVLVIAGGLGKRKRELRDTQNNVEVISVYPSVGCDNQTVPDMLSGNGLRSLHNLAYNPETPELLVCNSISESGNPTCDSWAPGMTDWLPDHSSPHKEDELREIQKELIAMTSSSSFYSHRMKDKEADCGRYASSSLTISGTVVIAGGMIQCNHKHEVVGTIKMLQTDYYGRREKNYWKAIGEMKNKRSFFCTVDLKDSNVMAIGGYSENKTILDSTEHFTISSNWTIWHGKHAYSGRLRNLANMAEARSGHSCTHLTSDRMLVLVSGGSKIENGEATSSSEIYDVDDNTWSTTHNMLQPRFGHAVVKIGDKVLAVGGSRLRPDVMTDSIETFDKERGWSRFPVKLKHQRANFGYALVPHSFFPGCKINSE